MARLVDSSVVIELERRDRQLGDLERLIPGEPFASAAITASELLVGVHRAVTERQRSRRQDAIEAMLGQVPIIPFDLPVARVHARVLAELTGAGQMVGRNDLLIAATALAHGYDGLTHNLRDFARVPGLVVHRPSW